MASEPTTISRVNRSRQATRTSYDHMSRWYDLFSGASERVFIDMGLKRLDIHPGERVLEIGPGTGYAFQQIARSAGVEGKAWGMDLSARMCLRAKARLTAAGEFPSAGVCCADATALPLQDGRLDAIFMAFTLELFDTPEIPQILAECRRLLRPSGRCGVISMAKSDGKPSAMLRLYEWAHAVIPIVDCRPIYAEVALAEAGFKITQASRHLMWGLPIAIISAMI